MTSLVKIVIKKLIILINKLILRFTKWRKGRKMSENRLKNARAVLLRCNDENIHGLEWDYKYHKRTAYHKDSNIC